MQIEVDDRGMCQSVLHHGVLDADVDVVQPAKSGWKVC